MELKSDNVNIAYKVKLFRKAIGWSREKLAEKSGVSFKTICNIERQGISRISTVEKIAVAMQLTLDELLGVKDVSLDNLSNKNKINDKNSVEIWDYIFSDDVSDLVFKNIKADLFSEKSLEKNLDLLVLKKAVFFSANKIFFDMYDCYGNVQVEIVEIKNKLLFKFFLKEKEFIIEHPLVCGYDKNIVGKLCFNFRKFLENLRMEFVGNLNLGG